MTDDEKDVLNKLAEAHNAFCKLQKIHPSDTREWTHNIHALQNIVMSRIAVRENPDFFYQVKD